MNKTLKKSLYIGLSALMFASVGASFSNIHANAMVNASNYIYEHHLPEQTNIKNHYKGRYHTTANMYGISYYNGHKLKVDNQDDVLKVDGKKEPDSVVKADLRIHKHHKRTRKHAVRRHKAYRRIHRAKRTRELSSSGAYAIKLKKPVKVSFVRMEDEPYKDHVVGAKRLPKGTYLHAWEKGTEGVDWLVYGKRAKITRRTWPSVYSLNSSNAKVVRHYHPNKNGDAKYGYMYTMKNVLHYKGM